MILSGTVCLAQNLPKQTTKHSMVKPKEALEFKSFIKERKFLDSPWEIASPEAERILMRTEKILSSGQSANEEWHRNWAREFIKYLKQGGGEYLVISPDSFIIYSYFASAWLSGVYFVDTSTKQFKILARGYDLEIVEKGIHPDGTHWLLCRYGGLTESKIFSGFILITYIDLGRPVRVQSTPLVDEVIAYPEENPTEISEKYWCGIPENRIEGISGEVLGYRWEDVNKDGQDDLIFTVKEKDCNKAGSPSVEIQRVFVISKGSVTPTKINE